MKDILKVNAIRAREKGRSLSEISKRVHISKSTASLWTRNIQLSKSARLILANRQRIGLALAQATLKRKRVNRAAILDTYARSAINNIKITKSLAQLLCSIFIWTEGGKKDKYRVSFTNSDPLMVTTFLSLFQKGFEPDSAKFRLLVHLHAYHEENKTLAYWSTITHIPRSQFTRTYKKINTGKRKRPNYMGSIRITYYDSQVAWQLRALYNTFAKHLGTW